MKTARLHRPSQASAVRSKRNPGAPARLPGDLTEARDLAS